MSTYQLLNKDNILGELKILQEDKRIQKLEWVKQFYKLPYWLDDINSWLSERIAVGRIHIGRLYDASNINSIQSFIEVCNASSLIDTLWIKDKQSLLTWDKVNLFKNKFNREISRFALSGDTSKLDWISINKYRSPEYTTVGSYDKCWKRENGNIVLIKKSLEKYSEGSGNEAFSECYASGLLENLIGLKPNRDFIPYTVSRYKDNYYISKCKCFTSERYGMIPISLADVDSYTTLDFLKFMSKLNKYSENLFRWMIVFDYISLNTDRHVGNIGLIIDNDTLEIKRMAPIFDNNLSFYPKITILDKSFKDIIDDLQEKSPKYDTSFEKALRDVITRDMVKHLENRYNTWNKNGFNIIDGISQERLDIINRVTRMRVENILNMKIQG